MIHCFLYLLPHSVFNIGSVVLDELKKKQGVLSQKILKIYLVYKKYLEILLLTMWDIFWTLSQTTTCKKLYCRAEFFKKSFFGRICIVEGTREYKYNNKTTAVLLLHSMQKWKNQCNELMCLCAQAQRLLENQHCLNISKPAVPLKRTTSLIYTQLQKSTILKNFIPQC